jgi:hypothetical protein
MVVPETTADGAGSVPDRIPLDDWIASVSASRGREAPPRVTAYVMLADPSFLEASLSAYYDRVDRIVLSYDESGQSWTGTPLPVDECLAAVARVDRDGKCLHRPGAFARLDHDPLENDTHQRQVALDAASVDADWVVQLDTDEVMLDAGRFFDALGHADRAQADALDYPARWLYARTAPGRYLERTDRLWRRAASYPGPLAVRAGTRLRHARQTDAPKFRVDFRSRSTDPWAPRDLPVDEVIGPEDAVMHFSWVRDPEVMRRKLAWSGHADQLKDPAIYRAWRWRMAHPLLAAAGTPFRHADWLRPATVAEPPGGAPPNAPGAVVRP